MTSVEFVQLCEALEQAQDRHWETCEAARLREREAPVVGRPTPPSVRRMQLADALPSDVRSVTELEFGPACRLASMTADESAAAWRDLKSHQISLRETECALGLPELRAAEARAWSAVETCWCELMAVQPPTLADVARKLRFIVDRSDFREELLGVYRDLIRLHQERS